MLRAFETAGSYRELADQFRARAERTRDPELAQGYRQLADGYDTLARHAERPRAYILDNGNPSRTDGPSR